MTTTQALLCPREAIGQQRTRVPPVVFFTRRAQRRLDWVFMERREDTSRLGVRKHLLCRAGMSAPVRAGREELICCVQCATCKRWRIIAQAGAGEMWSCRLPQATVEAHQCRCAVPVSMEARMKPGGQSGHVPQQADAPGLVPCTQCATCWRWRPVAAGMPLEGVWHCFLDVSVTGAGQRCACAAG